MDERDEEAPAARGEESSGTAETRTDAAAAESHVLRLYEDGRSAHPGIAVELLSFDRHLRALFGPTGDLTGVLSKRVLDRRGPDLYLAFALHGSAASFDEFSRQFRGLIASTAFKHSTNLTKRDPDEWLADLFQHLSSPPGDQDSGTRFGTYDGRCPLAGWIFQKLQGLISNERRAEDREEKKVGGLAAPAPSLTPAASAEAQDDVRFVARLVSETATQRLTKEAQLALQMQLDGCELTLIARIVSRSTLWVRRTFWRIERLAGRTLGASPTLDDTDRRHYRNLVKKVLQPNRQERRRPSRGNAGNPAQAVDL